MGNKSGGNFAPSAIAANIDGVVTPAPERSAAARGAALVLAGGVFAALATGSAEGRVAYAGGTGDPGSSQSNKVSAVAPEAMGAEPIPYGAETPIASGVPIRDSVAPGVYVMREMVATTPPDEKLTVVTYSQGGILGDSVEGDVTRINVANPCNQKGGALVVYPGLAALIGAEPCRTVHPESESVTEKNRLGDPVGMATPLNGDLLHDGIVIADTYAGWLLRHPSYDDPGLVKIDVTHEEGVTYETYAKPGDERPPLVELIENTLPIDVPPAEENFIASIVSQGDPVVPWAPPPPAPPQPQIIYTPSVPPEYQAPVNDAVGAINGGLAQMGIGIQVRLPGQ